MIFLSPAGVRVATLTPADDIHIHGEQKRSLALAPPSHRLQVERGLLKVLIVPELWSIPFLVVVGTYYRFPSSSSESDSEGSGGLTLL